MDTPTPLTYRQALESAAECLQTDSPSPRLDAEVLLAHVLERERSHLHAWPERELTPAAAARFEALLRRRAAGEPVAYLIGQREFWSLPLEVTPDTLIPRPETELLVERALARIPADADWTVADLGTGSGAIALALARERPRCRIIAVDRSVAALEVARRNATRLGLEQVEFRAGDWCQPLADVQPALIVSNPPYVASGDPHLTQGDVRFEPRGALQAGPDGLDAIRIIGFQARQCLAPGGRLLLEHGPDQGEAIRRLLQRYGHGEVQTFEDLEGRPRVTEACSPGPRT